MHYEYDIEIWKQVNTCYVSLLFKKNINNFNELKGEVGG